MWCVCVMMIPPIWKEEVESKLCITITRLVKQRRSEKQRIRLAEVTVLTHRILVDVSEIFYFFLVREGEEGSLIGQDGRGTGF